MDNLYGLEHPQSIAIIGMSGRFPGARDLDEFWRNITNGVESIRFFSDDELLAAGTDPLTLANPAFVKANGFLADSDLFDAGFFGLSPRDAEILDPQHRFFLECAWEALEDAGCEPEGYKGLIGVFAGSSLSSYMFNLYASNPAFDEIQVALGNDKDHLATRASYKLNLRGPSIAVQTACSTSLVAVALAYQNLLSYQCDIALAGGASIGATQVKGYFHQEGGIFSPDGHCRAFDAKGQGTIGGSGAGIVVLKRLPEALQDGDHIYAVIRGAALNNDGSLKAGYTAPSIEGQARVTAMAQAIAGVEPDSITYIEAHGTGTPLGDPIEIASLTQVFRAATNRIGFCGLGSVKTNIGHLDAAAGVAGLIKTVLALKHRAIPPSLHFEEPNPALDLESSPFYVNRSLTEWKAGATPRRAGVNSFGMGGTNAHIVLEEAPSTEPSGQSRPFQLLCLSARSKKALEQSTDRLIAHLRAHSELPLPDVAYTLHVGRKDFTRRRFLVSGDQTEAVELLERRAPEAVQGGLVPTKNRPIIFLFPGQGSQHINMLAGLYQEEPVFRETVDHCCSVLLPTLGLDLRNILHPTPVQAARAREQLLRTEITQPALFVMEYALARLWMDWGVTPQAMLGHSLGEYAAACLAGVFSLDDALWLVAERGKLMGSAAPGAMLAIPRSEREVASFLSDDISLAAVNGPAATVLSGPILAIDRLESELRSIGIECRRLHTSHAFHSAMMQSAMEGFLERLQTVRLWPPQITFLSNLTGNWISPELATDPSYWAAHLRHTVRFGDCVSELMKEPESIILEVGPGNQLTSLVRQHTGPASSHVLVTSARHPNQEHSDVEALLLALGRLWLNGIEIDWQRYYAFEHRARVSLPGYPFERQRYWIEPGGTVPEASSPYYLGAKRELSEWFYVPQWTPTLPAARLRSVPFSSEPKAWLILSDSHGISAEVGTQLRSAGHRVATVDEGESFSRVDERRYRLRPDSQADFEALLADLQNTDLMPDVILHFWTVSASERQPLERMEQLGFYSLLALAQALGSSRITNPIELGIVSNYLQSLDQTEIIHPEKALVLGPSTVIPQEFANLVCRTIDIGPDQSAQAASQIVAEFSEEPFAPLIAYRGSRRWVKGYEQVKIKPQSSTNPKLREHGVYLITGGFGGIGLVLAEALATSLHARLALVGRTGLPPRETWQNCICDHGEDHPLTKLILSVQNLEALGAEVFTIAADISNDAECKHAVGETIRHFGAIHGVVHSAGVPGGGIIQLKTPGIASQVFAPKVRGTLALHSALNDHPLDFFALCSSLSSVLGGGGQVDYCAANNFLDAFAHSLSSRMPVVAINWDAWSEVGMAVNTAVPEEMRSVREQTLGAGILSAEGAEAFLRLLGTRVPQVVVCTTDLNAMLSESMFHATMPEQLGDLENVIPQHGRPELTTSYVAPRDDRESSIAHVWENLLGIAPIGIHDNFFELGGHSLLAIQLLSQLREAANLDLAIRDLFSTPTIAEIAKRVPSVEELPDHELTQLLDQIERLSEEEAKTLLTQKGRFDAVSGSL